MKKIVFLVMFVLICAATSVCSAFELDRSQWVSYSDVDGVEAFYHERSIRNDGSVAKVWICYHYKGDTDMRYDTYRLALKEYTRGSEKTKILKTLVYHSDGTLKVASSEVVPDLNLGTNEENVLKRLW